MFKTLNFKLNHYQPVVYLDISALVKWYLAEANSDEVAAYIVGFDSAVISTLTKPTQHYPVLSNR